MIQTAYFHHQFSTDQHKAVCDFVSKRVWGDNGDWPYSLSVGVFDNDNLIGGVIYHDHDPLCGIIELSAASVSKKWLTRPVLRAIFALPFDLLDCQMCVLRVSSENGTMLRLARNLKFDEHVIPRLFGRGTDGHVFTFTEEQWRAHRVNRNMESDNG